MLLVSTHTIVFRFGVPPQFDGPPGAGRGAAGARACRGDGVLFGSDGGVAGRSLRVGTAAPASTRAVIVQAATESKVGRAVSACRRAVVGCL